MKKEIRTVDKKRGIIQVTAFDERHYYFPSEDEKGNPVYEFEPSVTWILSRGYPKGEALTRWVAKQGWNEAEEIKQAAGERGSRVHAAINKLIAGETVRLDEAFTSFNAEDPKPLTIDEWEAVLSFTRWFEKVKPVTIAAEFVVRNKEVGYAGTVDYLCIIEDMLYLIDFKTSQSVYPEHELQVSAYFHADWGEEPEYTIGKRKILKGKDSDIRLAILQLGYRKNKLGYKFTEVPDRFPLFLAARHIWEHEVGRQDPPRREYPIALALPKPLETK